MNFIATLLANLFTSSDIGQNTSDLDALCYEAFKTHLGKIPVCKQAIVAYRCKIINDLKSK